ncbi:hypothetical protein [Streptomyces sp. CA2R106]|uniref:hypothetical protein n=1 Tax=Streptomyces sp. CA2R106 TaxID=3120153 RepID=UPI00300ADEF4
MSHGLTVEVMRSGGSFARLLVVGEQGRQTKVDMEAVAGLRFAIESWAEELERHRDQEAR